MSNNLPVNHLLAQHKILLFFSIARQISSNDIRKIEKKLKPKYKNPIQLAQKVNEEIILHTKKMMLSEKIPGLIGEQKPNTKIENNKAFELNFMANQIGKSIYSKNLSKTEICYLILTILNTLGMTDQDFKNYHNINNENESDDNENDEDDEE